MIIIGKEFDLTGFNKRRINYLVSQIPNPKWVGLGAKRDLQARTD